MNLSASVTRCELDFSALLASMRTAPTGEGLRAEEIAEQTGISVETVRKRLRKALDRGLVRLTQKSVERIDGRTTRVSAYVICDSGQSVTDFSEQATL